MLKVCWLFIVEQAWVKFLWKQQNATNAIDYFFDKMCVGKPGTANFFSFNDPIDTIIDLLVASAVPTYVLPLKNRYCAKLDLVLRALDAAAFASLYNSILVPLVKLVQRELLSKSFGQRLEFD